ncbi:hypothetical protein AHF37_02618 [Paragonimus kellicotti]|nr:hypothetical protein AHF37_02618 [Paragonimus kellicotti]
MAIVLNEKMGSVLEANLNKLARYDVNTLLSSVLSLTKPTDEGGKAYVEFLRANLEQMRQKVTDELYILSFMEVSSSLTFACLTLRCWFVQSVFRSS